MLERKIGLEAEYLLLDEDGEVMVPFSWLDRDGFPLLGEVRGDPGDDMVDTVSNFRKQWLRTKGRIKSKKLTTVMTDVKRVRLAVYKEALKQVTEVKGEQIGKVKNINGTNIDDFSDQIIKRGKIQGINVSCGLHIHFSCVDRQERYIEKEKFEPLTLPLSVGEVVLYRKEGYKTAEKIVCSANQLNRPAIEYIVKEMDKTFFERFAPPKKDRTKYRQPGFFELKPYGFEYRSLPANPNTMKALPEITSKAFELLSSLNSWD